MHVLKVKATVDHRTKISCTYTAKNKSSGLLLRTGSWRTSRNKKPRIVKLLRNATLRGNGVISGLSAPCITIVPPTDIAFAICSICGPPTASKTISRCSPPKRKTSASYKSGSSSLAITSLTPRSVNVAFSLSSVYLQ